ncbi:hypothetical protein FRC06_002887, partial [Ceratobasidium sp. 370]
MAENAKSESIDALPPQEQLEPSQAPNETSGTTPGLPFRLWNPPVAASALAPPLSADLEPTAAEIAAAYQDQSKRAERLQNAPLMTQQMRDQQQKARLRKWPN